MIRNSSILDQKQKPTRCSMATPFSEELNRAIGKDELESLLTSLAASEITSDDFTFDEPDLAISKDSEFDKRAQSHDGFSFAANRKHIFNCAKRHKRTKAELLKDIREMVIIGLSRGNIRKDQLARTAPAGAERIKKLAYWYEIPMRSRARERIRMQSDTLTFVRAISCFPHLASTILYKKVGLAKNGEKTVLASELLPDAMKHSGFSGLIPKGCDPYLMKAYVFAHAAYLVDFYKLINSGNMESCFLDRLMDDISCDLKAEASKQLSYCKAVVEKSTYPDELRVRVLRDVGLTDPAVFKKILDVCSNLCKVVGEPELSFQTAEKYHIKNNMICFSEDDNKDVATGEQTKSLADKLKVASIHDASTSND